MGKRQAGKNWILYCIEILSFYWPLRIDDTFTGSESDWMEFFFSFSLQWPKNLYRSAWNTISKRWDRTGISFIFYVLFRASSAFGIGIGASTIGMLSAHQSTFISVGHQTSAQKTQNKTTIDKHIKCLNYGDKL